MSKRLAEVRLASLDDILGIRDTIEKARALAHEFLPEAEYPYALQYTMDLIAQGLCWVAVADGKVIGCAMADRGHWPWNRKAVFLDAMHFWVEPQARRGGVATGLIAAMRAKAADLGCPLRINITYPDGNAEIKDRMMRMAGFQYLGGSFWCK